MEVAIKRLSLLRQLAVCVVLAAIVGAAWFSYALIAPESERGGRGARPDRQILVEVAPVAATPTRDTVRAVGTGKAVRSVVLYPLSGGTVTGLLFEPGDMVEAGTPLLMLDDDAQAIELTRAQAELDNARQMLARLERLAPQGAVPATQVDEARATAALAEADVAAAALALDRRTLKAPFAGVVGLATVSVGDAVTTSTAISTIDDRREIVVEFEVAEAYAARLANGVPVVATAPALPGEIIAGTIAAVDSRLDPLARTLRVRAALDNDRDRLRPGMSFAVTLEFTGQALPAVPAVALQWDRDGPHVWTVQDGIARRVDVEVVERATDLVLVTAPLADGDPVVVEGLSRLIDGVAVTVENPPAAEDPAPKPAI